MKLLGINDKHGLHVDDIWVRVYINTLAYYLSGRKDNFIRVEYIIKGSTLLIDIVFSIFNIKYHIDGLILFLWVVELVLDIEILFAVKGFGPGWNIRMIWVVLLVNGVNQQVAFSDGFCEIN